MSNTFGKIFKITTYGESHGKAIGVVIDGCPAGLEIDEAFIEMQLQRRKPGQSKITTQRKEDEAFEITSGVFEGLSTGTPIHLMIRNKNQRSKDYSHIKDKFRPSHADFTWQNKFGHRDYRGGGRSSARETASRVAAGAIAQLLLNQFKIKITAFVNQVYNIKIDKHYSELDFAEIENNIVRCADAATAHKMEELIAKVKKDGDSVGGVIQCVIENCPVGLGAPVFDKLHADLGKAMLSINAVKAFEIGSGFDSVFKKGSELNDLFEEKDGKIITATNNSGGLQGGISNGMDIVFNVAFKPVATIMKDQKSVDATGNETTVSGKGRHDPCVVPRAVPIVEAMAALTIADFLLRARADKVEFS